MSKRRSSSSSSDSSPPSKRRKLSHNKSYSSKQPRLTVANRMAQKLPAFSTLSTFHDVEFIVGPADAQRTFPASKLLFSVQSEVFEAMFKGDSSAADSTRQRITLSDVTPAAFAYLHRLIYLTPNTVLSYAIVFDVLYAAQKYLIEVAIVA